MKWSVSGRAMLIALGALLVQASVAEAGYVRNWLAKRGGCDPGTLSLMDEELFAGPRSLLGKDTREWTEEDFEEYKNVLIECVSQYPRSFYFSEDPGNVGLKAKLQKRLDNVYKYTVARNLQVQGAKQAAAQAEIDLARDAERAKREKMLADAQRNREIAEQTRKQAEIEAPLIAEAERQYAEAAQARADAERRLDEIRGKIKAEQDKRLELDAKRMVAENEQRRATVEEDRRKIVADLSTKPCELSAANFERVRYGASLLSVQQTFGCTGTLASGVQVAGAGTYSTYLFKHPEGLSYVSMTFRGNSLETKSQFGLQ